MTPNPVNNPTGHTVKHTGLVWERLHSEREDICQAMLKQFQTPKANSASGERFDGNAIATANWHRLLLQARLRKVDDALDRLMTGSFGNCRRCGQWIEDTKLDFDPAIAYCLNCWYQIQTRH